MLIVKGLGGLWRTSYLRVLTIACLGASLLACSRGPLHTISPIRSETNQDCRQVAIEDLYTNPQSYAGEIVCTSGIANVEYHGQGIYPEQMIGRELLQRFLLIDTPLIDLVLNDYRSRDVVFARGRFDFNRNCFEPTTGLADDEEWMCLPIREPMYLAIENLALKSRPDPFDICREVAIGDLDSEPRDLAWQMICATGYLRRNEYEWFLIEDASLPAADLTNGLALGTLYMTGNEDRLVEGTQVYIAGNALGRSVELFDLRSSDED